MIFGTNRPSIVRPPKCPGVGESRASSETPERRTRVVGDRKSPVPSGVAESADVHTDQDGENTKGKGFLVVPIRNECARSVEDPSRSRPASRVPHSIGFRRDAQLGSERRLRALQRFPTLAEGLRRHGTTTVPSAHGT